MFIGNVVFRATHQMVMVRWRFGILFALCLFLKVYKVMSAWEKYNKKSQNFFQIHLSVCWSAP